MTDILLAKDIGDSTIIVVMGDDIRFISCIQNLSNKKALFWLYISSPSYSQDIFIKEHQQERKLVKGDY